MNTGKIERLERYRFVVVSAMVMVVVVVVVIVVRS